MLSRAEAAYVRMALDNWNRDRPVLAPTLQGLAAAVVTSCTDALT